MPVFPVDNDASFSRQIELAPEDERHLLRVLRARVGETSDVTNGIGQIARVKIASLEPLRLEVLSVHDGENPAPLTLHLPLIDQERMEWVVEKLTELNILEIRWIAPTRAQSKNLKPAKFERLKKAALAAQKQCGRAFPIVLGEVASFQEALVKAQGLRLAASFQGNAPSAGALAACAEAPLIHVFVGPEGGFTEEEERGLSSAGVLKVNLGGTVLRAETAAVAMAVLAKIALSNKK